MSAFKAVNGVATSPQGESTPVEAPAEAPPAEAPATEANSTPAPPAERPTRSSTPPMNRTSTEPPSGARESWPTQGPDRTGDEEGSHKRKRSESAEGAHHEHSGPEKTPENAAQPAPSTEDRDHYPTPVSREYRPYDEREREREREREHDLWGHGRRDEHSGYDYSGAHTNGHHDHDDPGSDPAHHQRAESEYSNTSPDAEERDGGKYSHIYAEIRGDHLLAHDPKKRKRNFSNRTKTGCLTCRKRKKKCDELKPECNNCVRGGFVCAGYPPQRGAWPTKIGIDHKPGAIPLESKDPSYIPPGAYGLPAMYGPPKRDNRGQPLRIDPPQGRPVMTDDDRYTASTIPSASVTSPDHNKMSTMPYTPANAFPTPVSANTQPPFDRMGKDYQRVPPMHEFSRPEHRGEHGNQLPQISMLHSARTSSPNTHSASVTSNPPAAGQHNANSSQYSSQRRTQKEEMLNGRHFYAFDKELCLERERCATACWRFNNLTAPPANGVSPDERARLFLDILQPREPIRLSPSEASPVTNVGRVGRHVAVETPFMSDYGYNISIGHHVVIGRNCTINDVCEVRIGDNCVIGPNVSIYTTNLPIDPKKRQGGQGPQYGRPVVIEQDCWIGGGATILPGRTIGKGSTVGAGSVVTKDVPPFTVVAGNPARVLRGIAS